MKVGNFWASNDCECFKNTISANLRRYASFSIRFLVIVILYSRVFMYVHVAGATCSICHKS